MPLPLELIKISDVTSQSRFLDVGESVLFYADITKVGTLNSEGYVVDDELLDPEVISLVVTLTTNLLIDFTSGVSEYNSIYIPSGTATYYLDKYGNTYSDSALTTSISGVASLELTSGIESVDIDENENKNILCGVSSGSDIPVEMESDCHEDGLGPEQTMQTCVQKIIDDSLVGIQTTITLLDSGIINSELKSTQELSKQVTDFIEMVIGGSTIFDMVEPSTINQTLSGYSQILDLEIEHINQTIPASDTVTIMLSSFTTLVSTIKSIQQFILQTPTTLEDNVQLTTTFLNALLGIDSFIEKISISSETIKQLSFIEIQQVLSLYSEFLNSAIRIIQTIPIVDSFHMSGLSMLQMEPIDKPEFKIAQFDCGNTSLKLLSGVKFYGNLPFDIEVSLHFMVSGLWYQTSFIGVTPQKIAYFNVQGEAFKLHFKTNHMNKLSLNIFEVMWKQTDKSNIRSAYYYGSQVDQ